MEVSYLLTDIFLIEIWDDCKESGETEDEPRDDPVKYFPVPAVLDPLNLLYYWQKRTPGKTNLANIDVSEEDDAHWEESVNTGDEVSVRTRRQYNIEPSWPLTGWLGYLHYEAAGHLDHKSVEDQRNVEQGQAAVNKYHLVDQRRWELVAHLAEQGDVDDAEQTGTDDGYYL